MRSPRWKTLRHWLEWAALRLASAVIPRLPRRGVLGLARLLGAIYHVMDRRARAVAMANLEVAFGGQFTPQERARIARRSAQNMARTFLDLFWASRLTPETAWRWFKIEWLDPELPENATGCGRLMMCQHFGNFEWMALAVGFCGIDLPAIEQSFKNPRLGPIFDRARTVSGNRMLPRDGAMVRVFKHLKSGGFLGMLPDLTLPPGKNSTVVSFLGMELSVTAMPAALRERTGCVIHPAVSLPQPDGTCRLLFHPGLDFATGATARQVTQGFWDFFEPWVRESPELWLWHYKHWRFRPDEAVVAYPFYANRSAKFEKLRAGAD